jgi:ATP-binding cassette subfamily B protein
MKPGETVALVGFSGNGKSSIMSLILRFYELDLNDSDAGEVLIDGVNIKDVNIQWLRRQIGYVPQEPVLFGMSIRDNIAFGMDDYEKASDDDIVHAAKEANAHDFIVGFPEGYDTLVGERGVRLSAGQKQRIAIARALLRKPKVLLLDEATSALDSVSEKLVQEALERAMADKTVLVIAHRLSTVKSASKILVVEQGRIVECGTYSELLRNNGKFFHLVQNQVESGSG